MKGFNQVLMILCYLSAGVWVERMADYFSAGNTGSGMWSILAAILCMVLGSLNLYYVKQDATKEAK